MSRKGFRNVRPKWDVFPFNLGERGEDKEEADSIFCSDFPDRTRVEDLFSLFKCVGKCVEVVISPRRNKWGKGLVLVGLRRRVT